MAIKIAKGPGASVQIGSSDYPLDQFRAHYLADRVKLIPRDVNLIKAARLEFMYADIVDGDGAAVGNTAAAVQTYLQANLYTQPEPTGGD